MLCMRAFHCNGAAANNMQIRKQVMWIDYVMNRTEINLFSAVILHFIWFIREEIQLNQIV